MVFLGFQLQNNRLKMVSASLNDQKYRRNPLVLKVLWIFKNIFETLHDLNDSDEKSRMLKTASKNSNGVKSNASFKIMQISI